MTNEELVKAIRAGNREFAAVLLDQNSGFMATIAHRYLPLAERNGGVDLDDLMQEAAIGMLAAIDAWDEERGAFLTIAGMYIRQALQNALGLRGRQRAENTPHISLNSPVKSKDGSETEFGNTLIDTSTENPQEKAEKDDLVRIVREEVNGLPADQREVLFARALEGVPRKELAARTGLPEHRLVYLENAGRSKLERNMRLYYLWLEYEGACDRHVSLTQFNNTRTSSTEAAVLKRAWLLGRNGGASR